MNIRSFRKVDVAIIGDGVGGLSAAQEVSGYTDDYVLIGPDLLSALPPRVFADWAHAWHLYGGRTSAGPLYGQQSGRPGI